MCASERERDERTRKDAIFLEVVAPRLERLAERAVQLDGRREDRRQDDQCQEDCVCEDEQDQVPPYNRPSLLALTKRENGSMDLLRWSQPEQRCRVKLVKVRDQAWQ